MPWWLFQARCLRELVLVLLICLAASGQVPTEQAAPSPSPTAGTATPAAPAGGVGSGLWGGRTGRRKAKDADKIISQLTLDEKLRLLNTNSPAINRSGVHIPAFNWW